MVTAKQVTLYTNVLPEPPLIEIKYTQVQQKETSKYNTITTEHRSATEKIRLTPPPRNMNGK